MNRFRTSFLTLIVLPVVAYGAEPNVVMLPGTTVPAYAGATTPAMLTQPLPVDPNVHFPSEYATNCAPRVGVLKSMMNWMCAPKATCPTGTCNATANYKPPVVAVAKVHHAKAKVVHDNACLDKLKAWFCWHPSKELGMPSFLAAPYQSPVQAYFRNCMEPAMGCNTGCVASGCAASGCAVGPVAAATVVQQTSLPGQTLMPGYRFAKATVPTAPAPSAIVPVGATAPVGPVAPKPNLLVRPFTNP